MPGGAFYMIIRSTRPVAQMAFKTFCAVVKDQILAKRSTICSAEESVVTVLGNIKANK